MTEEKPIFETQYRVYYEDTDASGVMYHARYLAFFERARTDALRALGFSQQSLMDEHAVAFTVSDLQVQYRKPARLDDELRIQVFVHELGKASLRFFQSMWCEGNCRATMTVRAACVRVDNFRPIRLPAAIHQSFQELITPHVI